MQSQFWQYLRGRASIVNADLEMLEPSIPTITHAISNNVLYYYRASDGSLTVGGSVATGGAGTGSALASQGAVVLTNNGRFLLVVDAGSNQISVFTVLSNGVPVFIQ